MPMHHVFRNRRFQIVRRPIDGDMGECDYDGRRIAIDPALSGIDLLDTTIHESLHACLPDADEYAVYATATDIATLLHRLGWRITKQN